MEAWDGYPCSSGTTDNNKILVVKQSHETKLNESIYSYSSEVIMRDHLDLNRSQLDKLRKDSFIDLNGYRYCVLYMPYYMIH